MPRGDGRETASSAGQPADGPPVNTTGPFSLTSLADMLWDERDVVELLLYKLVVAKLLLAADERRFVGPAVAEVNLAVDLLHRTERERADLVAATAREWGMPTDRLSLAFLAHTAPAGYRHVFAEHLRAFARLADEIEETARTNSQLTNAALTQVQESLRTLGADGPAVGAYNASGRASDDPARPYRVDQAL